MAGPQRMSSTMTSTTSAAFNTRINARLVTMKLGLGCGIVLGLIGASLLVAFGILYVKPYMLVKHMVRTQCVTVNYTLYEELVKCQCDDDNSCISNYPCLAIYVNFTNKHGKVVSNASLYDSQETFSLQESAQQCSYHECERSIQDNIDEVKSFSDQYSEPHTRYECFYNPDDSSYVLLNVVTTNNVIHAMLWPGLAFLVGAIILCIYVFEIGINHSATPLSGSPFNSLEKPWLRHVERNYEKVGALSEYHGDNEEHNDAHDDIA